MAKTASTIPARKPKSAAEKQQMEKEARLAAAAAAAQRGGASKPGGKKAPDLPDSAVAKPAAGSRSTAAKSSTSKGNVRPQPDAAARKPAGTKAAKAPARTVEPAAEAAAAALGEAPAKKSAKPSSAKARPAGAAKAAPSKANSGKAPGNGNGAAAAASASAKNATSSGGRKSAERPWIKSYPRGIPAEITPLNVSSIGDLLVDSCRRFAGRPAFTCMDKTLTYAEVERKSAAFGAWLQSRGLQKGARVAIMMPNVLQYPVAMMAVLRAGYTVVNVNPLYTPRELEHQLNDSGAEAIVILENFATTLQQCIAKTKVKHVVVAAMGDLLGVKGIVVNLVVRRVKKMVPAWSLPGHVTFNQATKAGEKLTFKPAKVEADDIAFLQYTGGTTGVSKGAVLLHRNVLANVAQNALWVESAYSRKPRPDRLTYICALPLYHIYALTVNAVMGMQQGAHNILIPNPRDIPAFVKEYGKYPINVFPGLNTLFNALLNNEEFQKLDFKPLILTFGGGMAVQSGVAERWKKLTGIVISEGYGLSETSPVATGNRFDAEEFSGTIGLPIPSTEIAIRDDDGKDMPLGEVGEICIRGPQVMAGYWNRPDETAKVMTSDGFFKSGDMGFMNDDGYIKIVDRKKDMILVSGFNVYPNELEDVVAQHPGVLEVAAVGVPDEKSGEVPKLFVVKKDPNLTAEQIIDFCKDKLTAYKRPRHVEFRNDLPKTNVGKILRRELRG